MAGFYSGIFGLVVLCGFLIWFISKERKAGATTEKLKQEEANAKTAERISEATSSSPRTPTELSNRLRKPGGKL